MKHSTYLPKNLAMYAGTKNEVTTEVKLESSDETAWLVVKGTTGVIETLRAGTLDEYYNSLDILDHIANGDFDTWTEREHYPEYPIKVLDTSLGTMSANATKRGVASLILGKDNKWYEKAFDSTLSLSSAARQIYHNEVNYFLKRDTVILSVPAFQAVNHVRKVVETLNLGVGKVWDASRDLIEQAQGRREAYRAGQSLRQNGRENELGEEPRKPKLMVAVVGSTQKINMFEQEKGQFNVFANGVKQTELPWDGDDKLVVDGWLTIRDSSHLSVQRIS